MLFKKFLYQTTKNSFLKKEQKSKLITQKQSTYTFFFYIAIGQKQTTVASIYTLLKKMGVSKTTNLLAANASAHYSECTLGDIFYLHSRLVERAAKLSEKKFKKLYFQPRIQKQKIIPLKSPCQFNCIISKVDTTNFCNFLKKTVTRCKIYIPNPYRKKSKDFQYWFFISSRKITYELIHKNSLTIYKKLKDIYLKKNIKFRCKAILKNKSIVFNLVKTPILLKKIKKIIKKITS